MQQRVAPRSFIDFPGPSLDGEASAHATTALRLPYHQTCSDTVMARSERNQTNQGFASWWFQPNGKILVKLDHFPNFRDEKSKIYELPPLSFYCFEVWSPWKKSIWKWENWLIKNWYGNPTIQLSKFSISTYVQWIQLAACEISWDCGGR